MPWLPQQYRVAATHVGALVDPATPVALERNLSITCDPLRLPPTPVEIRADPAPYHLHGALQAKRSRYLLPACN
jgi:hypothetical protein